MPNARYFAAPAGFQEVGVKRGYAEMALAVPLWQVSAGRQ